MAGGSRFGDYYRLGPIQPTGAPGPYIIALVVAKLLRSVGWYLCYDILKVNHIIQFVFIAKLISGIIFVLLQQPLSSGKRVTKHQWLRVLRHALVNCAITLLWLLGLTLCGPLRTILITEQSEIVVIAAVGVVVTTTGATSPSRNRAALMFILGLFIMVLFDLDGVEVKSTLHHSSLDHNQARVTHMFYTLISMTGLSDHKGGLVVLAVVLFLKIMFNGMSRTLSVDLGGAKRLHSLSTLISACLLSPLAVYSYYMNPVVVPWSSLAAPVLISTISLYIIDYYIHSVCINRLDIHRTSRLSAIAMFAAAIALALFWNHPYTGHMTSASQIQQVVTEHAVSGGVLVATVLFILATNILGSPPSRQSTRGSFIGYSTDGQPLYSYAEQVLHRTSVSVSSIVRTGLKQIIAEQDSRQIFYFLCINMMFTFVELTYGVWTNSLGLICDGFHMLFDCSALIMGLFAAVASKWKATRMYSYGYGRIEVLSGYVNGLFLAVIALSVFVEAFNRLLEPPEINTDRLLTVSVAGLLVNLIGIFAFRNAGHGHSHGGGGSHGHSHTHTHTHGHTSHDQCSKDQKSGTTHNTNMQGVFLHVLADTLGSVGVIISSILIQSFGWFIADPICSLFTAVLIFLSVLPLLKESSMILLQRVPLFQEQNLNEALKKVLLVEGVVSYQKQHFWQQCSGINAGTLHVQVVPEADEQIIIQQVVSLFKESGVIEFSVQIEKEEYFHHMSVLNSSWSDVSKSVQFTINHSTHLKDTILPL